MARRTSEQESAQLSPHLPPLKAWKNPEQWLDLRTGLPRTDITPIRVPYHEGLVDIDALVKKVYTELFVPGFEWSYNPKDPQTRPDDHHFYFTKNEYNPIFHDGNETPLEFRELAVNIGRLPRQFHNTLHDFAERPTMPDMDVMKDYVTAYNLAHTAFKDLYIAARTTLVSMGQFPMRRQAVASGGLQPKFDDDAIGEAFLRQRFTKHFGNYERAVDRYLETEGKEIVYKEHEKLKVTRPQIVVKKIGGVVSRKSVVIRLEEPINTT